MGVAVQNARDYREKLEQAIRDPLTGLYNRRFLLEALEKEVQRSARYGSEASLVIFDVDDFKLVNDRYGHAAGDDVLRAVGRLAESVIRPADSFARIGGEEFALMLPETSQLEALLVAERVRTAIAREKILPDRKVTVSGGIASCPSTRARPTRSSAWPTGRCTSPSATARTSAPWPARSPRPTAARPRPPRAWSPTSTRSSR
jgi:diguanylate cyclase (GGDEF)-like protein